MAYELHIEKPGGSISLEEWASAVADISGLRLCSARPTAVNPKTGEIISLALKDWAELYSSKDEEWHLVFYWSHGRISFKITSWQKKKPDDVWLAATALARRLSAVVCGDEGEIYSHDTKKTDVVQPSYQQQHAKSSEKIKIVFRQNTAIPAVILGIQNVLHRSGVSSPAFKLNGNSFEWHRIMRDVTNSPRKSFELTSKDYSILFGTVARWNLDFLEIKSLSEPIIPWDNWAAQFISDENFVMAWVMNVEYDHWQNAEDPLQYAAADKPYKHLAMKSNGLPYPMEQQVIDTANNPGRWRFRVGYIEAVGATMWFSDLFWRLAGTDKSSLLKTNWLRVTHPSATITKVQAADNCFLTAEGTIAELQRKLRVLLFGQAVA